MILLSKISQQSCSGPQAYIFLTDLTSTITLDCNCVFYSGTGVNLPLNFDTSNGTPLDYFQLLFPTALWEVIVDNTNKFADWSANNRRPDSKWKQTTLPEMLAHIGLKIIMGTNTRAVRRDYWSKNEFIGQPGFRATMSCNRFDKIERYFHVSDRESEPNKDSPEYDRLCKVRVVLDTFSETFKSAYTIGRDVSIDECMIAFSGQLAIKQYMPAKPIKRGLKLWARSCSRTAYMDMFEIYLGKQDGGYPQGLGHSVVTNLTLDLVGSYRHIYFDNFFSSVRLCKDLLANELYMCGTIRPQRLGFPRELVKVKLQRGDSACKQIGNVVAWTWMDRKNVHVLSSNSQPDQFDRIQRRTKVGYIDLDRPNAISLYNQYMCGVDRHDQMRACYDLGKHSKKWWITLFHNLLNIAIVNAYILYKDSSQRQTRVKRYTHLHFRRELALQLINGFTSHKKKKKAIKIHHLGEFNHTHELTRMRTTIRCKLHVYRGLPRTETIFGCLKCGLNLCPESCYDELHANDDLRRRVVRLHGEDRSVTD